MKKTLVFILLLFSVASIRAQIRAITETGDEVILYTNKTWKYANDSVTIDKPIPLNEKEFSKGKKSTFLVKSNRIDVGVWINPKQWSFTKSTNVTAAEYQFKMNDSDLYGMLITEKVQIPIESLKNIVFENAKSAAPDVTILHEEYRMVNGIKVLMMKMSGSVQGINFVYLGYYYSSPNGTIQLLTYTSENLLQTYLDDINDFLNGFVEIK